MTKNNQVSTSQSDEFFENPLDVHQILIDFGNLNVDSNKKDYSLLHDLIQKCINEIKDSMIQQFAEIVKQSKIQASLVFEKRPLYVLFEKELNCDVQTDHITPKNVYPIFKERIEIMFDQIQKVINGYTTTQLISAEEKVAILCKQILVEITEVNDYLIVELITKSTESEKFQQLVDTQKVKNLSEQQNLRKRIQMLKEQIMEKRKVGMIYNADFLKEVNEASEYKNSVSSLNDRFKTIAIRNGQLESENAKMKGQLEIFGNQNQFLDKTIKELDKIKQAYIILQNKYVTVTNNLTEEGDKLEDIKGKLSKYENTFTLFSERLIMFGDDPDQVANNNVQYLTEEQIVQRFAPKKLTQNQTVQTQINMQKMDTLNSDDNFISSESYQERQNSDKEINHKFVQTLQVFIGSEQQSQSTGGQFLQQNDSNVDNSTKSLNTVTASPIRNQNTQNFNINQMTLQGGNIKDVSQELLNQLLQQLGFTSLEQLENFKATQKALDVKKALESGARSLNVREVNFDTQNDDIQIKDHSENFKALIKQSSKKHLDNRSISKEKHQSNNSYSKKQKLDHSKSNNHIDSESRDQSKLTKDPKNNINKNINYSNDEKYQSSNQSMSNNNLQSNSNHIQCTMSPNGHFYDLNGKLIGFNNGNFDKSLNDFDLYNKNNNNNQNQSENGIQNSLNNHNNSLLLSPGGHCIDRNGERIALSERQNAQNKLDADKFSDQQSHNLTKNSLQTDNENLFHKSPSGQIYPQTSLLKNTPTYQQSNNENLNKDISELSNFEKIGEGLLKSPGGRLYAADGTFILNSDDPILAARYMQAANQFLSESQKLHAGTIIQMFQSLEQNQKNMFDKREKSLQKLSEESAKIWERLVKSRVNQPTLDALKQFNVDFLKQIKQEFEQKKNSIVGTSKCLPITQNLMNLEGLILDKLAKTKLNAVISSQHLEQQQQFQITKQHEIQNYLPDASNQLLMSVKARNMQKMQLQQPKSTTKFGMRSLNVMLPKSGLIQTRGLPGRDLPRSVSQMKK